MLRRDQYGLAVALVALTMIMMAVSSESWWSLMLTIVVEGATLLFILWTSAVPQRVLAVAAALVVIAILIAGVLVAQGGAVADGTVAALGILLALYAPVAIVLHLLENLRITASTVAGALCVYLIGGLFFAYVFGLVSAANHGQFFVQEAHPPRVDYLYFSLVTLTTVGYGDYTASSPLGKMLAVSEALSGQLYLVSVVAVLVSNIGHERTPRTPRHHEREKNASGKDTGE
jgi:hypothetical protein